MISCFSMLMRLCYRMLLFWIHKGSDYTVPTQSWLKQRRRLFFFWRSPPNSPNNMNLRPGCNERNTTKCLLLKMLFCFTNNGTKTMLIAR